MFYKELKSTCDPDKLLNISKKGIFLCEPLYKFEKIKYHEYVIDISLYARQYFFIYNKKQYERFFYCFKNFDLYNIFDLYYTDINFINLIIFNKFFLKQLIKEKNNSKVNLIFNSVRTTYILKYLYKFKFITSKAYYLFSIDKIVDPQFEFMTFFYYNEDNYIFSHNIEKYNYYRIDMIVYYIYQFGYDINMLKYCVSLLKKFNILKDSSNHDNIFKLPLNFPLNVYKKYSEEIFYKNNYIVEHEDKYFEKVINILLSDKYMSAIGDINSLLHLYKINCIKRYGIDINLIKHSKIEKKYEDNYKASEKPFNSYGFNSIKYKNNSKNNLPIIDVLNSNNNIEKILKKPNYLFTLNINFNKYDMEARVVYIVSLIHNNYNKIIIKYLTSFISVCYNAIIFENNKIVFYDRVDVDGYNYLKTFLLEIKNETFKSYLEFKDFTKRRIRNFIENF